MSRFILIFLLSLTGSHSLSFAAEEKGPPKNLKRNAASFCADLSSAKKPRLEDHTSLSNWFCPAIADKLKNQGYCLPELEREWGEEDDIFCDDRIIASGSESFVWKIVRKQPDGSEILFALKCPVSAIKFTPDERLQLESAEDDALSILRSQVECTALQMLAESKSVVNCVEYASSSQGDAVVLPYFDKTLSFFLTEEPRPLQFDEIDLVVRRLLQGLIDSSSCGPNGSIKIVHNDIKPANILISLFGGKIIDAQLADFATSTFVNQAGEYALMFRENGLLPLSRTGTPGWVAPEVA